MNGNYCIMILDVGDIPYAQYSKPVLNHYFTKHKIPFHYVQEPPRGIDVRGSHPSWWKLLAHSILPGYDYIICWDLDMLPRTPDVSVLREFDWNRPTMAWDAGIRLDPSGRLQHDFLKNFKYNGGLIGIPKRYQTFFENTFYKHAPGRLPSYEQYYLNDELQEQNISVHELPDDINVFYGLPAFGKARLQHYTCGKDAKHFLNDHYQRYMSTLSIELFDTRLDMIAKLVPTHGTYAEMGVLAGEFSKQLFTILNPKKLVLIDLFEGYTGSGDQDGNNMQMYNLQECRNAIQITYCRNPEVILEQGDTVQCLSKYDDNSFDMIYIDADHSFTGVQRDLTMAFQKVKPNGWIMGHDYDMNMEKAKSYYNFGTKAAVDQFCEMYNQQIYAKAMDGCISYAIRISKSPKAEM